MAFATSITVECRKLEIKIAKQQREIEQLKAHIFRLEAAAFLKRDKNS